MQAGANFSNPSVGTRDGHNLFLECNRTSCGKRSRSSDAKAVTEMRRFALSPFRTKAANRKVKLSDAKTGAKGSNAENPAHPSDIAFSISWMAQQLDPSSAHIMVARDSEARLADISVIHERRKRDYFLSVCGRLRRIFQARMVLPLMLEPNIDG